MRKVLWCCAAVVACAAATPGLARAQSAAGAGSGAGAGAAIYHVKCAMCHGPQGRGNGPMASAMNPRPVDFTDASKRLAKTDSAVRDVIRRGRRAMPAFGQQLSPAQLDSVVAFVKALPH